MKSSLILAVILSLLVSFSACFYPNHIRYDGTYRGKIVDEETREPIEDVVVLGVWHKVYATPAGGMSEYNDAYETLTNEKGEFCIPGKGIIIFPYIAPINITIFKSGYSFYGGGSWLSLRHSEYCKERVKWDGDKPIIPLKKLTMEERKELGYPSIPLGVPREKVKLLNRERNREREVLGYEMGMRQDGLRR